MEDHTKIISQSSPNLNASGNNENESEHHRNLQQKSEKFMAPTIAASSKMTIPKKKKILAEWKPPILDSKSELHKMGISNSYSRNSSTKNPSFSSPENEVVVNSEEESCVLDDSCATPYDPLTNYLSPRPKFLRYNPNRKRKLIFQRVNKMGSVSPNGSTDCESSSGSSESSSKSEEIEGFDQITEEEVVEEDDEDDGQGIIEGRNWGLKWMFFKGLVVFIAWLFFTVFISSMNSPAIYSDSVNGIKVGDDSFDNITLRVVSLLNDNSRRGWLLPKIETTPKIESSSQEIKEFEEVENPGVDLESEEDTRTLDDVKDMINMNADFYQMDTFKDKHEGIPPMIVEKQYEDGEVEILVPGSKSEDGVNEIVAPMIAPDSNDVVNQEEKEINLEDQMNDVAPKSQDVEVETGAEGSPNVVDEKVKGDYDHVKVVYSLEFKDVLSHDVLGWVNFIDYSKQFILSRSRNFWFGGAAMMFVMQVMMRIWWYRNRRTIIAAVKAMWRSYIRGQGVQDEETGALLTSTSAEGLDQVHQESSGSQMNIELTSVVAHQRTSGSVPVVSQLGQVDLAGGSSQSATTSTGLRSRMGREEGSLPADSDDKKGKRKKGSSSTITTPESPSISRVEGNRETSAVRRSARLQSRGVRSP